MNPRVSKSKVTPPRLHVDESLSLEEQIAHRAYELRQQRGDHSKPGSDWTDWFHAEREITEWHRKRLQKYPTQTLGVP
jgi:hypothetical protein